MLARLPVTLEVSPYLYEPAAEPKLRGDGLFTTNPPVRELTDLAERPDEIWVVQINPQRRDKEPRTMIDRTAMVRIARRRVPLVRPVRCVACTTY